MKRRASDRGPLCWLALRAAQFWDFVDKRDIDKHALSWAIFYGTIKVTEWAMGFVEAHPGVDPLHAAAVMAAVLAPYTALQGAAMKWYFDARSS